MNTYTFFSDPGHGWLRVPVADVVASGVRVSRFSYTDGHYVYLEEDLDAHTFVEAVDVFLVRYVEMEEDYWIRDLERYVCQTT